MALTRTNENQQKVALIGSGIPEQNEFGGNYEFTSPNSSNSNDQRHLISKEKKGEVGIEARVEMVNGEYVLKLKKAPTSTESERTHQLALSGALLLFQGDMLRNLGLQLLSRL